MIFFAKKNLSIKRCRMLNKKLLNYILNVKHTIIDDVKMFDDDSIVFYVHPSKGQQCRCGICGRKSPYYDAGRGYRLWRTTDIIVVQLSRQKSKTFIMN